MIKKTFKEVRELNVAISQYFKRISTAEQTKLGYALKRISDTEIKKVLGEYREAYDKLAFENLEKPAIELALVDKVTGAVLMAPKGSERVYQYNKENLVKVMEVEKNFQKIANDLIDDFDKKEFDIEPYLVKEIPEDLLPKEVEAFKGFVLE